VASLSSLAHQNGNAPPGERLLVTRILNGPEAIREARRVLQGLKLRFRVRVVVADMGAIVAFGDTKVGQQMGHSL